MLDEFSQRVEAALLREFPWLRNHILREFKGEPIQYSLIYVPAPHGGKKLYIYTEDEEITLGRGAWHRHIGEEEGDVGDQITAGIEWIHDLMSDRMVPVDKFKGDEWTGCATLPDDAPITTEAGECAVIRYWLKPEEWIGDGPRPQH